MIHSGTMVRAEPDPSLWVHGAVSGDRTEALFAVVCLDSSAEDRPDRVRLPGLDPAVRYRVTVVPGLSDPGRSIAAPPWLASGVELPGSVLERVGVALPVLHPQSGVLLSVSTVTIG